MRTSCFSSIPVCFFTVSRTAAITASMSEAVAPPGVHNEIRMLRRNHGATDTKPLKPTRLDESRRLVILRIAEHGSGIRQV